MTTTNRIDFDKAYYIKLGENGQWEKSSLAEGKLRIGWAEQPLEDINHARWEVIRKQLVRSQRDKGAVTRDLNALRKICESNSQHVWVTFSVSRLWWCRVGKPGILEDATSKYRALVGNWCDRDVHGNVLSIDRIPGILSRKRSASAEQRAT